jgi:hypothetical protein
MTAMLKLQQFHLRERLETSLQWSHGRTFSGFVFDAADASRIFVVELLVDGHPVKCMRAADHVGALVARGIGNGCYGFAFSLAEDALQGDEVIETRIANLDTPVGEPIELGKPGNVTAAGPGAASSGAIRWLGGLRFSGWIAEGGEPFVDIVVDGERIDRVRASGWSHIGGIEDPRAVRTFECTLPMRFADRSTRRLAATNPEGEPLEGSPQPFFASSGGLGHGAARIGSKAAVIIVGTGDIDATSQSLDGQCHLDWVAASLPEAGDFAGFENEAAQKFLAGEAADAAFVVFLLAGARLNAAALTRLAGTFANDARVAVVYGDVDIHAFALRRPAAEAALGSGVGNLYQVLDSVLGDGSRPVEAVVHLPDAMALLPS